MYGGDFIDLGKGGEFGMVNPLEIVMDADEEDWRKMVDEFVASKKGEGQ